MFLQTTAKSIVRTSKATNKILSALISALVVVSSANLGVMIFAISQGNGTQVLDSIEGRQRKSAYYYNQILQRLIAFLVAQLVITICFVNLSVKIKAEFLDLTIESIEDMKNFVSSGDFSKADLDAALAILKEDMKQFREFREIPKKIVSLEEES